MPMLDADADANGRFRSVANFCSFCPLSLSLLLFSRRKGAARWLTSDTDPGTAVSAVSLGGSHVLAWRGLWTLANALQFVASQRIISMCLSP